MNTIGRWLVVGVLLLSYGCAGQGGTSSPLAAATRVPEPISPLTATVVPAKATAVPAPPSPRPSTTPVRERLGNLAEAVREVNYCTGDRLNLKLDLYLPEAPKHTPAPLLLYIHGNTADKSEVYFMNRVLEAGYAIASMNYRDAPGYKLPAAIEDAKCAVRFLRMNAAEYKIDGEHIGAYGCSYGGYLAAMLAVTKDADGFEGSGGYPEASSQVRAATSLSGFGDWTKLITEADVNGFLTAQYFFGRIERDDPILARASPVSYLSDAIPPLLLLHGDADDIVPISQAQELYDRSKEQGADVALTVVPGGDHCLANQAGTPALDEIIQTMLRFFDENLK